MPIRTVPATVGELNAEVVDPGRLLDEWRSATGPLFRTEVVGEPAEFDVGITAHRVGGLVISRVRYDATTFRRTEAEVRGPAHQPIAVELYRSGSIRGQVDGTELRLDPHRIGIQDFSCPYEGRAARSELLVVAIPRHRLRGARSLGRDRPLVTFPVDGGAGAILQDALLALWRQVDSGAVHAAAATTDAFVDLVDELLADDPLGGASGARAAMVAYLLSNLDDPTLGVAQLQRRFHWSRSAIYRLFEPEGGVRTFIRTQRLARIREGLAHPRGPRVTVRSVARRYGIDDPTQLHRAFRREFGVAPSEVLASADPADGGTWIERDPDPAARLRSWLIDA